MKSLSIVLVTAALLSTPGCTRIVGPKPVTECRPKNVSAMAELEKAPVWVPDSPARAGMPDTGCIGGNGSHHTDRLCVVGDVQGIPSIEQALGIVRTKSLRLLGAKLQTNLSAVLSNQSHPPPDTQVTVFSKQLRDSIGRITDTWQSPNCRMFAIAELRRVDFVLVVEGPDLPPGSRALLLQSADQITGAPAP